MVVCDRPRRVAAMAYMVKPTRVSPARVSLSLCGDRSQFGRSMLAISLHDLFSERGENELGSELAGLVGHVEERVDLRDLDGEDLAGIGDRLHGQVGLAVGGPAALGGADAGGVQRIDEVHVDGEM